MTVMLECGVAPLFWRSPHTKLPLTCLLLILVALLTISILRRPGLLPSSHVTFTTLFRRRTFLPHPSSPAPTTHLPLHPVSLSANLDLKQRSTAYFDPFDTSLTIKQEPLNKHTRFSTSRVPNLTPRMNGSSPRFCHVLSENERNGEGERREKGRKEG